ncbi:hypothetical protein FF098_012250 [Parvularcula flava]|uniref:Uncharacterized protein n=1 Tax=Aquisalinus luteolus TaxID=1566827 RepID=A0A8J3A3D1_9PROT|nr:hypothetical protein [Aquisalinus luteolus]NHK28682.1 hypothetical protein [Aquisalinus luteolus]GGH99202.1 hypothetical protein GCM10011355_24600 [Aquisalinus luteolus]
MEFFLFFLIMGILAGIHSLHKRIDKLERLLSDEPLPGEAIPPDTTGRD